MATIPQPFPPTYPITGKIIPNKTVLYLDPFNSTDGKIIDNSGYGNHAIVSGPADKTLSYGKAKYFDAFDDYISISNSNTLDITSAPLSIFMWIKVASTAGTGYMICKNLSSAFNVQYGMYFVTASNTVQTNLNSKNVVATDAISRENWHCVGFTYDGINVQNYVDGNKSGALTPFTDPLPTQPYLRIGRRETGTAYFKGSIGEVWIIRDVTSRMAKNLFEETAWKYGVKI